MPAPTRVKNPNGGPDLMWMDRKEFLPLFRDKEWMKLDFDIDESEDTLRTANVYLKSNVIGSPIIVHRVRELHGTLQFLAELRPLH